jgi:hypothetical protein
MTTPRPVLSTRHVTRELRVFENVSPKEGFEASVGLLPNEKIRSVELTAGTQITTARKVIIQAPKSVADTRFFIMVPGETELPVWSDGFASQAAARAELTARLPRVVITDDFDPDRDAISLDFEIVSMTRRVDGSPLVTATVRPHTYTAIYDVIIDLHEAN